MVYFVVRTLQAYGINRDSDGVPAFTLVRNRTILPMRSVKRHFVAKIKNISVSTSFRRKFYSSDKDRLSVVNYV